MNVVAGPYQALSSSSKTSNHVLCDFSVTWFFKRFQCFTTCVHNNLRTWNDAIDAIPKNVHLILKFSVFHGCLLWSAPLYDNNLHHMALAANNVEVDQATRWGGNDVSFDVRFLGLRCLFILEFLILVTCEFGNQAVLSCLGFSCMKNIMFTSVFWLCRSFLLAGPNVFWLG